MRRTPLLHATACSAFLTGSAALADNYDTLVVAPSPRPGDGDESAPKPVAPNFDKPAQRRSGFVIGLTYGVGTASSSGYPNDQNFIGDPTYYGASGVLFGTGGSGFIMGALSDWLTFGFWFGSATSGNKVAHSTGAGGGLRLELFPLYSLGGALRDLGAYTEVGIGSAKLTFKDDPGNPQTGVGSFLAGGLFYEFWLAKALGGHFALGPDLRYDAIFSEPLERHGITLGLRFLWYGGSAGR
jgi:hypothetical protein